MGDKSVMSARQAGELDQAFERNGCSAEDVKELSKGSVLANVRLVVRGDAVIKMKVTSDSKLEPVFSGGSGVKLPATPARKGNAFPKSKVVSYPGSSLSLLPEAQPAGEAKLIVPYRLRTNTSFAQMVGDRFGMVGRPLVDIEEAVIAQGMTVTPDQIAFMLKVTAENPEWNPFGLVLNGYANFWLVKVSDQTGERLAVVYGDWRGSALAWGVYAARFDDAYKWNAERVVSFGKSL